MSPQDQTLLENNDCISLEEYYDRVNTFHAAEPQSFFLQPGLNPNFGIQAIFYPEETKQNRNQDYADPVEAGQQSKVMIDVASIAGDQIQHLQLFQKREDINWCVQASNHRTELPSLSQDSPQHCLLNQKCKPICSEQESQLLNCKQLDTQHAKLGLQPQTKNKKDRSKLSHFYCLAHKQINIILTAKGVLNFKQKMCTRCQRPKSAKKRCWFCFCEECVDQLNQIRQATKKKKRIRQWFCLQNILKIPQNVYILRNHVKGNGDQLTEKEYRAAAVKRFEAGGASQQAFQRFMKGLEPENQNETRTIGQHRKDTGVNLILGDERRGHKHKLEESQRKQKKATNTQKESRKTNKLVSQSELSIQTDY